MSVLTAEKAYMETLSPWLPIALLFLLTTVLAFVVIGLSGLLGPRRGSLRKLMPYESGMTPIGAANQRVPVRFYLVAIEFILFDIEIIFLLPYALVYRDLAAYGLAAAGIFVFFVIAGYLYAIKKGTLRWD
jgi:NADH-quinone oxidoreductase subunit A